MPANTETEHRAKNKWGRKKFSNHPCPTNPSQTPALSKRRNLRNQFLDQSRAKDDDYVLKVLSPPPLKTSSLKPFRSRKHVKIALLLPKQVAVKPKTPPPTPTKPQPEPVSSSSWCTIS